MFLNVQLNKCPSTVTVLPETTLITYNTGMIYANECILIVTLDYQIYNVINFMFPLVKKCSYLGS